MEYMLKVKLGKGFSRFSENDFFFIKVPLPTNCFSTKIIISYKFGSCTGENKEI